MTIYPVREGIEYLLTYIRPDAFCKACGKNEAWARQRMKRYKHNSDNDFYYFSQQDCDLINESLSKIADYLETIRIPNTHSSSNATMARDEIKDMISVIRVQKVRKELGYNKDRWHDRISELDERYWFKQEELMIMRKQIRTVCSILRNMQVEYEEV